MLNNLEHERQPITDVSIVICLDPLSKSKESRLHVTATLSTHLLVDHSVFICELTSIFRRYLALCFEVTFSGN